MKPFVFDPLIVNPSDVARRDYLGFFVEQILAHRVDLRLRATLEFHIKWLAYDETRTHENQTQICAMLNNFTTIS